VKRWGYRLFGELHVPGRIRSGHIIKRIERLGLISRPIRMLDAGSGRGDLAIHLARRCPHWQIVGVDLSPSRTETAQSVSQKLGLNNADFRTGSLEELGFRDAFDLIVSADVLEHIEDDRRALRNMFLALRPGGYLIVTSPSIPQRRHLGLVRWREKRIGFHPSDYGHVRDGYSKLEIQEKFREAGGRAVSCYFPFGLFGTLAFDLFFVIGDNQPNPIVFGLLFPLLLALGWLDVRFLSETGSAILAVGTKGAATASA
jgi:ubiquinone/menaquinone biosynthesis C-methylase UbiE